MDPEIFVYFIAWRHISLPDVTSCDKQRITVNMDGRIKGRMTNILYSNVYFSLLSRNMIAV